MRGGVGSGLPPEGCTQATHGGCWLEAAHQLVGGYTSAAPFMAARPAAVALLLSKVPSLLYYCPPPPPVNMWSDISPEKLGLLVHSEASGAPIELKITGGGEHSFVPPKDLTFLCFCTLEEIRADHREAKLVVRTPPPYSLLHEQAWDFHNVQCFTLLPPGKREPNVDTWHFLASQPPFLIEHCKPIIPLAVGGKVCMLNACTCTLEFVDFV